MISPRRFIDKCLAKGGEFDSAIDFPVTDPLFKEYSGLNISLLRDRDCECDILRD
jgi:hypothetical protein